MYTVFSATTYDLVQGYLVCQPLGEHILPGTMAPGFSTTAFPEAFPPWAPQRPYPILRSRSKLHRAPPGSGAFRSRQQLRQIGAGESTLPRFFKHGLARLWRQSWHDVVARVTSNESARSCAGNSEGNVAAAMVGMNVASPWHLL